MPPDRSKGGRIPTHLFLIIHPTSPALGLVFTLFTSLKSNVVSAPILQPPMQSISLSTNQRAGMVPCNCFESRNHQQSFTASKQQQEIGFTDVRNENWMRRGRGRKEKGIKWGVCEAVCNYGSFPHIHTRDAQFWIQGHRPSAVYVTYSDQ